MLARDLFRVRAHIRPVGGLEAGARLLATFSGSAPIYEAQSKQSLLFGQHLLERLCRWHLCAPCHVDLRLLIFLVMRPDVPGLILRRALQLSICICVRNRIRSQRIRTWCWSWCWKLGLFAREELSSSMQDLNWCHFPLLFKGFLDQEIIFPYFSQGFLDQELIFPYFSRDFWTRSSFSLFFPGILGSGAHFSLFSQGFLDQELIFPYFSQGFLDQELIFPYFPRDSWIRSSFFPIFPGIFGPGAHFSLFSPGLLGPGAHFSQGILDLMQLSLGRRLSPTASWPNPVS